MMYYFKNHVRVLNASDIAVLNQVLQQEDPRDSLETLELIWFEEDKIAVQNFGPLQMQDARDDFLASLSTTTSSFDAAPVQLLDPVQSTDYDSFETINFATGGVTCST